MICYRRKLRINFDCSSVVFGPDVDLFLPHEHLGNSVILSINDVFGALAEEYRRAYRYEFKHAGQVCTPYGVKEAP